MAADVRHYGLRLVHRSLRRRLLAGPWSMAIVQCSEAPADMEQRVRQLEGQLASGLQLSPSAVWRQLSTPVKHPGAMRQLAKARAGVSHPFEGSQ